MTSRRRIVARKNKTTNTPELLDWLEKSILAMSGLAIVMEKYPDPESEQRAEDVRVATWQLKQWRDEIKDQAR